MNSTILSRAAKIIPDADLLVNVVRLRVRQLVAGHRPLIAVPPGMGLADVALSEVAENKLQSEPKPSAVEITVLPQPAAAIITFPGVKPPVKKKAA
jgi:DNA-directed RNA polymerase subunit K/omega